MSVKYSSSYCPTLELQSNLLYHYNIQLSRLRLSNLCLVLLLLNYCNVYFVYHAIKNENKFTYTH